MRLVIVIVKVQAAKALNRPNFLRLEKRSLSMYNCIAKKMENQLICIVCAKACLTVNDHITCTDCSRSLHKSCSTSKVNDTSFTNKKLVSSCLLCDSRAVDASFDKHFDSTRPDNFTLGICNENSNY